MRTGHIFAGCGGGILADLLLGHEPCLAIEHDHRRCSVLRDRYRGLHVAEGDVRGMGFGQWHGRLDAIHAGVPCPRWSTARRGVGDPPDLSREVLRVVSEIRPEWVFIECVRGFVAEFPRLRTSFRDIRYTAARPLLLDGAAVGAPHVRPRCWIACHSDDHGQPVFPVYAEAPWMSEADPTPWEVDPARLQVADGVADRWEMECAGDGQIPLCAAVAWKLLGLP